MSLDPTHVEPAYLLGRLFAAYERIQSDAAGRELWTAENLNQPAAAYTRFVSASPLRANNFCSFQCTLDPTTGKIVESIFYK